VTDDDADETRAPLSQGDPVPDHDDYARERAGWRRGLADDAALRQQAVELQVAAERHRYTYSWDWLGVPVIRMADDIMVLQELFWSYRPQRVVETGVARGGSMLLDASLMRLCGEPAAVLGIDIAIFPHTRNALAGHPQAEGVQLYEGDSTEPAARERAREFLVGAERAVLVLDSNHTHEHVLAELRSLAPLLPVGSFVLIADTLVEEFPAGHYENRPWDRGNNPATAAHEFLEEQSDFVLDAEWSRRALVTEFRDGVLRRVR
jgi:cephalosporin hydroxylase